MWLLVVLVLRLVESVCDRPMLLLIVGTTFVLVSVIFLLCLLP